MLESLWMHYTFCGIYLLIPTIGIPLHFRFCWIVWKTPDLNRNTVYQLLVHASLADALNLFLNGVAVLATLRLEEMPPMMNKVVGAVWQGAWAASYPVILVLAVNRFLIMFFPPRYADAIFTEKSVTYWKLLCGLHGLFNTALCLTPDCSTLYLFDHYTFYFTNGSWTSELMTNWDIYGAEFVVLVSVTVYALIFTKLFIMTLNLSTSVSGHDRAIIVQMFATFLFTGVNCCLWAFPPSESDIYYASFNILSTLRFAIQPIVAVLTNRTIRKHFFAKDVDNCPIFYTQQTEFSHPGRRRTK